MYAGLYLVKKLFDCSYLSTIYHIKSCKSDTFDVSTTSNIYPSSLSDFAEKTDFCHVIAKIDKLCEVIIANPIDLIPAFRIKRRQICFKIITTLGRLIAL